MGLRLDVDPLTYDAASKAVGEIAGCVDRATVDLGERLADSAQMAGADPAGTAWAGAYDEAAAMSIGASEDVINGCYQLAALLQQTGFNYSRAESWSRPGALDRLADRTDYASCSARLSALPSAEGGAGSGPTGWGMIAHLVGYLWPGGDQGRLRAAAAAWTEAAAGVGNATLHIQDAITCIASQVSPEVDDATTACWAMDGHVWDLGAVYRSLAGACSDFAGHIDKAHSEIEHELLNLVEWSAALQVSGGLFAVVSLGLSELAAQGAQAARIAATALRVGHIIERLIELARAAAETVAAASTRAVQISGGLRSLLGTRISVATMEAVRELPAIPTAERVAVQGLTRAEQASKRVDRILGTLRAGRRKPNLEVDSPAELERVWAELSTGGKPVSTRFPGTHLQLPDGTRIGYRMYSRSGGPAIEITMTDKTIIKVHLR